MTKARTKPSAKPYPKKQIENITGYFKKRKTLFTFCIIFLIALIPRISVLFNNNDYFGYEQGIDMLIAKKIVIDHEFPLLGYEVGGIGGFAKGPGWNYLLTIPFIISNGDPFAGRILMFILSIATVLLGFYLFRKIFGVTTAFFIAIFLSISPTLINHSGIVWPPLAMPILVIFYAFAVFQILQKKINYLPLTALSVGLMTHFEIASSGILFIELFLLSIYLFNKKLLSWNYILFSLILFVLTLSPILLFDIQNEFTNSKGFLGLLFATKNFPTQIDLFNRFDNYFWNFRHTFTPNIYVSIILIALLSLATRIYTIDKNNSQASRLFILFLILNPFFSFILLFLYKGVIFEWWLIYQSVFYCLAAGIMSFYFLKKKKIRFIAIATLLLLLLIFAFKSCINLQQTLSTIKERNNIKRAIPIEYIYNNSRDEKFRIKIIAPRKNTEEYKYLIWLEEYRRKKSQSQNPKYEYFIIERNEKDLGEKINMLKYNSEKNIELKATFENGIYTVLKYNLAL